MTEVQPAAIDEYLAGLDEADRGLVQDAYAVARRIAPEAVPGLSYGMPALVLHDKGLISVQRAKTHLGVYPFSSAVVAQFADEFADDMVSKGAMRFPLGAAIPTDLLERVVAARVEEIDAKR